MTKRQNKKGIIPCPLCVEGNETILGLPDANAADPAGPAPGYMSLVGIAGKALAIWDLSGVRNNKNRFEENIENIRGNIAMVRRRVRVGC